MKVIRRLSRRGNSTMVSIPPQMIDYMRWRIADGVVVEVLDVDRLLIRRALATDMSGTPVQPMTLDHAAPVGK